MDRSDIPGRRPSGIWGPVGYHSLTEDYVATVREPFDLPAFAGSDLNLAGWAKRLTGKISCAVGGIGLSNGLDQTLAGAETEATNNLDRVLSRFESCEFDLVMVGRGMLGDPDWSNRVRTGQPPAPFDRAALTTLT